MIKAFCDRCGKEDKSCEEFDLKMSKITVDKVCRSAFGDVKDVVTFHVEICDDCLRIVEDVLRGKAYAE